MKARLAILVLLLPALAACGTSKPLERPAPLWGAARTKYEAEQARQKAEAEAHAGTKPVKPSEAPPPPPPRPTIPSSPLDAPKLPGE